MNRIIIAEDDPHLAQGLVALFECEGYGCTAAADGAAAWAAFERDPESLFILDVALPVIDGITLCRRIRAAAPAVPILILSARREEMDRVLGFEAGADDYVTKPFSARELVARVRAILKRVRAAFGDRSFRFGDLTVDPASQRAQRDGETIDLHAREIAILRYLFERPGQVVTRDELMDVAWGRAWFPNSRAVDQYISVLRGKIERDRRHPELIVTVWGRGYRYGV